MLKVLGGALKLPYKPKKCSVAAAVALAACAWSPPPEQPVHQLTHTGARNGQAAWSRRGTAIAFVSNRSGGWQVWSMTRAGDSVRQMTSAAGPVGWPSWSADDHTLFYYEALGEDFGVRRVDVSDLEPTPLPGLETGSLRPTISPDGRHFLFDGWRGVAERNHDLFLYHLATDTWTQLTTNPGYDSDARWSPDGRAIVFHSDRGAFRFHTQVFVMAAQGGEVHAVTRGAANNAYPAWSPNGECIVYTSEMDGNRDLWLTDRQGTQHKRLTWAAGFDGDPAWHPAGQVILFTTDRFGGQELAVLEIGSADRSTCAA